MEEINDTNAAETNEGANPNPGWAGTSARANNRTVPIENGRGTAVNVPVGADFAAEIDRIALEANYGGYYRVFLNGQEILEPSEAPAKIEEGMRIAITSYDKVG